MSSELASCPCSAARLDVPTRLSVKEAAEFAPARFHVDLVRVYYDSPDYPPHKVSYGGRRGR